MSVLNILNMLSPAPQAPLSEDYDGLQYRWKMFVFRPALFRNEAILFGGILLFLGWFYVGQYVNTQRANSTLKSLKNTIDAQFLRSREKLASSGPAQHLMYSSGRRNALGLHTTIMLYPIHDIFSLFLSFGKSLIEPTAEFGESIVFNLTLGKGDEGKQGEGIGVWAVTEKSQMRLREKRWDLTFPRLQEHSSVPITHALFSEHSDINDAVLKTPSVGVTELLANKQAASVLKYLLVTDQPANKPTKGPLPEKFKRREIVLAVYRPSSKAEIEAVNAWLQVALNIADLLAKPNLIRQDVARKLVKTREQVAIDLASDYNKYQAEETGALSKEEQAEEKRLAKKKAQREKLSEKELKKVEELEKKREARKMAKKQMMGK